MPNDPVAAVERYWSLLGAGDYAGAWQRLSPGFQGRAHHGDFTDYVTGHETMKVCSIATTGAVLRPAGGETVVDAIVLYRTGRSCRPSRDALTFHLLPAPDGGWWIDRVVRR